MTNKLVKDFLSQSGGGLFLALKKSILYPHAKRRRLAADILAKTADYTVTLTDLKNERIINNTGAGGTIVLTLPAVAKAKGYILLVNVLAAQIVRALPQTGEIINYNGSAVVTKYLNIAGVIGNFAEIYSDGTQWIVVNANGVVTKEA